MDRRRFLLGSAAGAGLLAGCTGEQPRPAQTMPNGTENGSNTTENGTMGTETMDNGTTSTETANGTDSGGMGGETGVSEGAGLVTVESSQSFDATVGRIRSAIRNNDALTLMTTVDHAANAQSAGMQLAPDDASDLRQPQPGDAADAGESLDRDRPSPENPRLGRGGLGVRDLQRSPVPRRAPRDRRSGRDPEHDCERARKPCDRQRRLSKRNERRQGFGFRTPLGTDPSATSSSASITSVPH